MKKYFIIIIPVLIIVLIILILLKVNNQNQQVEYKSLIEIDGNKATVENQNLNNIKINNILFILDGKESNVNFELINETGNLEYIEKIVGYIYDSKDELISTIYLPIYHDIKPRESISLGLTIDCDLSKAKKIKFELQ